jgi:hypothetical protein
VGEERPEGGRGVRKNVRGVVPRVPIRAARRVFRCEIHTGGILTRARDGWSKMRPINGRQMVVSRTVKSEMSAGALLVYAAGAALVALHGAAYSNRPPNELPVAVAAFQRRDPS